MMLDGSKESPSFFRHRLFSSLKFVWESGRGLTLASIGLRFINGLLPLVILYLIKLLIDAVLAGLNAENPLAEFAQVGWLVALTGGGILLGAACNTAVDLVTRVQSRAVTDHMAKIIHDKSVEVDLEYYENAQYYDTLHRAQQEAEYRPTAMLLALLHIGQNSISLVAIGGLLFWIHWAVVPILLVAALPELLTRIRFATKLYRWQRNRTPDRRKADYLHWILTRDEQAKEVRLFGLGSEFIHWFNKIRHTLRREQNHLEVRQFIGILLAQTAAILLLFGVYGFVAYRTLEGFLTIGDFVMYFQALQRGSLMLQALGNALSGLYEGNLFISNLFEFLELKPKIKDPQFPAVFPQPIRKGLTFEHVSFRYPNGTRPVLEDVSFSIAPGEHVALVGENGVGKTSLVKLLCRLYDPTGGRITLDGVDIRKYSFEALRKEISVVFQDFAKYQMTAKENIWLGNLSVPPDLQKVAQAARQAGVENLIERMPNGYDTLLGRWFEKGEELSIGEWQKMALARAYFRDSQILVLDEPTSAMDAQSEVELFERFHVLAKDRMAIFISHRLSTVKKADRIYTMANGRIIEGGTHEELVKQDGKYAHLFGLQSRPYR